MKRVFKYQLTWNDTVSVEIPPSANLLCFAVQNDVPCIWALVDPEEKPAAWSIRIAGTGHSIEQPAGEYIGTAHNVRGGLVFHAFVQYRPLPNIATP